MTNRLSYIDGMRGLAIMLVVGFHAFARWPELMPFGASYQDIFLFKYGWLGVQLFFLISGFVITMTLERSSDLKTYLVKRWLRLFPAMLICSAIIYATSILLPERPAGSPALFDLLPGLLFIDPFVLTKLSGITAVSLESAFWSLYVEVLFYIFAAIAFVVFGKNLLFPILLLAYGAAVLGEFLNSNYQSPSADLLYSITHHLKWIHFGWFAAGCGLYRYQQHNENKLLYMAIVTCLLSSLWVAQMNLSIAVGAIALSAIFILSIISPVAQKILANRILVWLGFISYPLYLLHENFMVGLTIKFSNLLPGINPLVFLAISIALIFALSYWVAYSLEPKARKFLSYRTRTNN